MFTQNDVFQVLRDAGMASSKLVTTQTVSHLTHLLNKRLEKFLPPRISEALVREIVRDEMKKAGE